MPVRKSSSYEKFRKNFLGRNRPATDEPSLPKTLSTITSEKLSDWMVLYGAWREYTEDLLLDALSELLKVQEEYNYKYDVAILQTRGNTVREKEAKVATTPHIYELAQKFNEAQLFHDLLAKRKESYDNCLTIISREITRRGSEDAYKK